VLTTLAAGIALPLNAMGRPGLPSATRLAQLGVRRLSSATGPFRAAYGAMLAATKTFLADGDTTGYAATVGDLPNLNARFG
jgi:2-methylisocitrate lyase-like PEP mutase family enzyme